MKLKNIAIASILAIAAILAGCATSKDTNKNSMTIDATGTAQGINLHLGNIPEDTYSLSISIFETNSNVLDSESLGTTIYIWDKDLLELRESGYLHCPFAKSGHEYTVVVTVFTFDDYNNDFEIKN